MSLLCEDTAYINYNLKEAVFYNSLAITNYNLLSKRDVKKFEKTINLNGLLERQTYLEEKWFDIIKISNSIPKISEFINNSQYEYLIKDAKKIKFDIVISQTNTIDSLEVLYNQIDLTSDQKERVQDKIYKIEFQISQDANTMESYQFFIVQYPSAPQIDSARTLKHFAYIEHIKSVNTVEAYNEFILKYPSSAEAKKMLILRNNLLLDDGIHGFIYPTVYQYLPNQFCMPNASRSYRNGIHEGLDFLANRKSPIFSVFDGVIVRIDTVLMDLSLKEYDKMMLVTKEKGNKAPILDYLRGIQVWIQHSDSVYSRYCHLSRTNPDFKLGDIVRQGEIIGYGGNSGLNWSRYKQNRNDNYGQHLHFEIRYGDAYLGKGFPYSEVKRLYEKVFHE